MKKLNILLVDGSPLVYQAFSSVGHFKTTTGIPTGVVYGFLRSLRSWAERLKADKVVIAWDSKGPVLKAANQEEYKANRVFTEEKQSMYSQVPLLKSTLSSTNYDQVESVGHEADDLLGTLSRSYSKQGHTVIIATVDRDMFSAVTPSVKVFHTHTKETQKHLITEVEVQDYYGVPPYLVPMYKAIFGDTSDNVKRLKHRLSEIDGLDVIMKYDGEVESTAKAFGVDQKDLEDRLNLCSLAEVPQAQMDWIWGSADEESLQSKFAALEFKSMMKFIPDFVGGYRWIR